MLDEVPVGWERVEQGQVATFFNGRAYKQTEWEDAGVPVIRLQNLTGSGKNYYYSKLSLPDHQYCDRGDLLYMWSATFGPHIWTGKRAIYHYHIWKVVPDETRLNKLFHFYLLELNTDRWIKAADGMAMLHLKKRDMEKLPISLPPLPEQERIAEILTSVDDSIRATEAVIAQAERVKRGLMEDLLTGGLGSEAIARGEVPDGWVATHAREIAIAKGLQTGPFGSQLKAAEYSDSDSDELTCVVMPKDIVDGRINFDTCARIEDTKAETLSRHTLRKGDVLFARRGDLSKVAVYDEPARRAICGTGCLRLRPDLGKTTYRFLRLVFTSHEAIQWLIANAVGATMLNLNTEIIGKLPLLIPSVEEQERIAGVIESLESQVQENRKTMAQLQTVKRGLMDDLLTGRVRTV